jgi:pantoate--beta-alanine ligase
MRTVHTITELREVVDQVRFGGAGTRGEGARIALVPTMGNLHEGHVALVEAAHSQADFIVTSIFVNPLQFGPDEDFASYPRTLAEDSEALAAAGVDVVFAPHDTEVYPDGRDEQTQVLVPHLTTILCGESRPGHFDGVATVVSKLFNMVQPDVALFGQKDFQQLTLIRTMVRQLNVPIEIIGVPTVRADDGLALSSRNRYLNKEQRQVAPALFRALTAMVEQLQSGSRDVQALEKAACQALSAAGLTPDYVAIRSAASLGPIEPDTTEARVLGAAYLGQARLIDNLPATLNPTRLESGR